MKLKLFVCLLAITILSLIILVSHINKNDMNDNNIYGETEEDIIYSRRLLTLMVENPSTNTIFNAMPDTELDTNWNTMPEPGIPFNYRYQDQDQSMTLNIDSTYYNKETTLGCNIEFDEDGKLDSTVSYIEILDDHLANVNISIGKVLIAGAPMFKWLDVNCTLAPAVKIIDIEHFNDLGILILRIEEVDMFGYIDDVDCNITNGTLIDSGFDVGEIQRVKNLAKFFGNGSTVTNSNGTTLNVTFSNITYTEMETVCYNSSENGTLLTEIPMIDGLCEGLSAVDYFGQSRGVDTFTFGDNSFSGDDTEFGVDVIDNPFIGEDNTERRRLFFRRIRRFFRRVKRVVKKVVQFVKDVVDLLKGDVNKRLFEQSLSIDASKSYSISGVEESTDDGADISVEGEFEFSSGVEFFASIHADLRAKYKIFSLKPSFDLFRLTVGGETRFKAYIDIHVDGSVTISYELARVDKRFIFMLGPIPIVIRPFAAISVGLETNAFLDFTMEVGYHPTSWEYGIEWTKETNEFRKIEKPLQLVPYKNFGSEQNDDGACIDITVAPFIEIAVGVVFYEIVSIAIAPKISLPIQFQFPATCSSTDICAHSPYLANFALDIQFSIALKLEVGILAPEAEKIFKNINFPSIEKSFPLFESDPISLFDQCFAVGPLLTFIGDTCCGNSNEEELIDIWTFDKEEDLDDFSVNDFLSIFGTIFGSVSVELLTSTDCPNQLEPVSCVELDGPSSMNTDINTAGYKDIKVVFDINSAGVNTVDCELKWSDDTNTESQIVASNGNGPFLNVEILFDAVFNDASSINLKISAINRARCYLDNLRIFGTPLH